jgi:hypothetical protein
MGGGRRCPDEGRRASRDPGRDTSHPSEYTATIYGRAW